MEYKHTPQSLHFASILMAMTFLAHVLLGGPELYEPLCDSDVPDELKSVFSVLWHFVSLQLLLMSIAIWWLAKHENGPLFHFVFITALGFAILFIVYGLIDLGGLWIMPQWIAFGSVVGLMVFSWFRA